MNWEIVGIIAQIVETTVVLVTAICGLCKYFYEKRVEKRNRTIEKVGELLEEYHREFDEIGINKDFKKDVRFLSKIEQFCIAIESGVYCKETVKIYGSKFLSYLVKEYKNTVIAKKRKNYKDDDVISDTEVSYYYLEKLVKSFKQEAANV